MKTKRRKSILRVAITFVLCGILAGCTKSDDLGAELVSRKDDCRQLAISCPLGLVCDENYLYRAYSYEDEELFFYISFDPDIVNNYSLELFRDNFNHMYFFIFFPERATGNSTFYATIDTPIRELGKPTKEGFEFNIISYENGRLKGELKGTITRITEKIESGFEDCGTGDIIGICYKTEEVNLPINMEFDFCIE